MHILKCGDEVFAYRNSVGKRMRAIVQRARDHNVVVKFYDGIEKKVLRRDLSLKADDVGASTSSSSSDSEPSIPKRKHRNAARAPKLDRGMFVEVREGGSWEIGEVKDFSMRIGWVDVVLERNANKVRKEWRPDSIRIAGVPSKRPPKQREKEQPLPTLLATQKPSRGKGVRRPSGRQRPHPYPRVQIRKEEMDGNCLYRAFAHQVYGDSDLHPRVRKECMDYMNKEKKFYQDFWMTTRSRTCSRSNGRTVIGEIMWISSP